MRDKRDKKSKTRMVAVAITVTLLAASSVYTVSAQAAVLLGTADPFAILAGSTVTNTGSSNITGDLGLHPGSSVTGFPPGTLNGDLHIGDGVAQGAKADLLVAFNDAAGRPANQTLDTELGGKTLLPGVYTAGEGTFGITGELTLDAQNDTDAVWIFKMATTLTTAVDSSVILTNGGQACNVYWQVGSSATINGGTEIKGNILAQTSISMNEGATLEGRALALDAAVTLINNDITIAQCAEPPGEEPPGEEPPGEEPPGEEPPGEEPPGEEPPGEEPPGEEPPGEEPPGEEPPGEEPPGEEPPGEEPPGEEPPGEEPPGEEPPGEEPPGEEPPGEEPPLQCVTDLMVSANGDTSITLTWNPVNGAQQYRIHRATGGGALALHGEVDGNVTTFADTDTEVGLAYGYEVRPVVNGIELENCDRVDVTAIPVFPGLLAGALAFLGALVAYPLGRRRP